MSALKIQKAVDENLLAPDGKFSLGFDKKEKEDKTEGSGVPDLQIHTRVIVSLKTQTNKQPETR